ncbi:cyclic nucleotide-gated ion channel 4 isoform X2 [Dioscorea cayenensis subsp. rotundata]|uniref:Cyclic nucleotide-gated ion channel 4 isoform X2 n=1 Tax=Dioscorea cayennensis subsp. rotundata TaxID=55577 RepID=A0AB40BTI0_DIOCR|nr:cyclic nucleotide-gated ion channel 4 isoform X2 [Dioscorea cayenensis subsp. rotundata]XP_039130748.1 cyclic nucleotide-gated ion channel 4 isoform X2 [Dioscorea cayenensis subsp. rotundata]
MATPSTSRATTTTTTTTTITMDVSVNSSDTQTSYEEEVNSNQTSKTTTSQRSNWFLGRAASHRPNWAQEWSRAYLLACAAGLIIDPLFFYTLSISNSLMCLFIDGWFAITLTILRCMVDAMHVWNMWLQLKLAYKARRPHEDQEEEGNNKFHSNSSFHGKRLGYLRNMKCFFLDFIVILPVMQIVLWVAIPALIRKGSTTTVMTVFLIMFLVHYLPKIYHSVCFLRRMQNFSGYIFGTIWWGIALNLIAYFVASHAVGACWYLLGIQRAAKCLKEQCMENKACGRTALSCVEPIYYGTKTIIEDRERLAWASNTHARATCLDSSDQFSYGAYKWTVPLVTNTSRLEKILLPIFWGLMTLSTFGNLESTTEWVEIVFNIIIITSGLLLVTMLIGNIKVFLHATTSKKQAMHLRMRSVEWWMRKKHLPQGFRQRVRQYERQRWAAMRGVDECEMIRNLPEGLRRDIKYHLCLDLVRQVPLFQHMDDLVLENICDRVKSLIFPKGETITREGDPVQRMLFVVRGHLESSQVLRDGVKSRCMLGPGNFSGDELLSWCLRRPFIERLPLSSSTLVTLETTEAFGLDASDVKYVTQHFRYTFVNEKVRRSARYYSPGWRTWAAVAIQLAWRRYRHRKTLTSLSFIRPRRPLSRCNSLGEEKLRLYTALLTSPKPDQDDFLL